MISGSPVRSGSPCAAAVATAKQSLRATGSLAFRRALALEREGDGRPRMEPDPVAKSLRDHHLALGTDAVDHAGQV